MKKFLHMLTLALALSGAMAWSMGAAKPAAGQGEGKEAAAKPGAKAAKANGEQHGGNPEECARKHASGECQGHEPGQAHGSGQNSDVKK
jgi:hypothetical protein